VSNADDLMRNATEDIGESERGQLANELLREFFRGYPLDNLKVLLHSSNADALRTGVWIASELGKIAKPLLRDVAPLLKHPDGRVRFDAIDNALTCAGIGDGDVIATVLSCLTDQVGFVRWKALDFFIRASSEQLEQAAEYLEIGNIEGSEMVSALHWLMIDTARSSDTIKSKLNSLSPIERKIGVVAAARSSDPGDVLLRSAAESKDEDIQKIATSVLKSRQLEREIADARLQRQRGEQ